MDKLKVGLIAQGMMGRYYGKMIKNRIKNAILIAGSSTDSADLDFLRYELDLNQSYRDHTRLLELNELDAIIICADPAYHADYISDSLDANFHVFCEKPMSLSESESEKVISHASRRPSQYCRVGFERRFDKAYKDAKNEILAGKIGEPYLIQSHTLSSTSVNMENSIIKSQGIFFDFALGDIDIAHWLLDSKLTDLTANAYLVSNKNNDEAKSVIASGTFENSKLAQLTLCKMRPSGFHSGAEIFGTEGSILIKDEVSHIRTYSSGGIQFQRNMSALDRFKDAYEDQLQSFVNTILKTEKFFHNYNEAAEATEVAVKLSNQI